MTPRRRCSRGAGLFDALIALAILSFGLLAITRFQGRMVAQATESQTRQVATQLATELLSTVLVDRDNAACYTLPQNGSCAQTAAITRTAAWAARAAGALPGPVATTANLNAATSRMVVTITWQGKESGVQRTLQTETDVR